MEIEILAPTGGSSGGGRGGRGGGSGSGGSGASGGGGDGAANGGGGGPPPPPSPTGRSAFRYLVFLYEECDFGDGPGFWLWRRHVVGRNSAVRRYPLPIVSSLLHHSS